jgi:hypothetical protein
LFPPQPGRPAKTERGLIRKINRQLPDHQRVRKARPQHRWAVGTYYVVDENHQYRGHIAYRRLELISL